VRRAQEIRLKWRGEDDPPVARLAHRDNRLGRTRRTPSQRLRP
jgi:hypothetical protein